MITKKTYKALKIIEKNPKISPRKFGELMWENSEARTRVYNIGNGATRGSGLWLCAGSYLAKLRNRKLVSHFDNTLSNKGHEEIELYKKYLFELGDAPSDRNDQKCVNEQKSAAE